MTAIAGIWDFRGGRNIVTDCARMLTAQSVYGQDGERRWAGEGVALGRRLARLLPEDVHDAQPLAGASGRLVLVADLRLDNREDLITKLGIPAGKAALMCDAALLLAAFERWGEECCEELVGDYAFALWNAGAQRLLLARDLIGARPLHYHRSAAFFAFSSMPKGLHSLAEVPRVPDEERAAEFLALMPDYGSRTFFRGIERVEPGHIVTVSRSGIHKRRHWSWRPRTLRLRRSEEYVEAMKWHLDQAVRSRLRGADGRVAAHLSGGLDSSAVVTTAARLLAPSGGRVVAFTAVPRPGYDLPVPQRRLGDEGPLAAATAALYPNIEHVLVTRGERMPLDTLDRGFYLCDRPILNLCLLVWGRSINDAVRARKLNILLTGAMGNLTISYNGSELLAEMIRDFRWLSWVRIVGAIMRRRHWRLRGALCATFAPWLPPRLWQLLCRLYYGKALEIREYSAIRPERFAELDLASQAREYGVDFAYRPRNDGLAFRLWLLSGLDPGNYHKGTLAEWGIDVRDPTIDRRLLEFCLSVPTEEFFRDGVPRALARAALADRVPPEVLNEKRRGLQGVDWHEALTEARPQVLEEISRLEHSAPAARALDLARLRRLAENWPTEGWQGEDAIQNYRSALLRGISVGHFLRRASGSNA